MGRGMLPTFLVVGAQKAGTSSLWAYLRAHPDVFMAPEKEPRFFVGERGWGQGRSWYGDLFAGAGGAVARGEASTDYTAFPVYAGVPQRIAALVPDVRIVYVVRHPLERMRSAYRHALWDGLESRPVDVALLRDPGYLYRSQYAMQLEQYLEVLSASQVLVVTAEQLRADRTATLRLVLAFIGADPDVLPGNLSVEFHASEGRDMPRPWARAVGDVLLRTGAGAMVPASLGRLAGRLSRRRVAPGSFAIGSELEQRLLTLLRPDLVRLRRILGPGFDCWGLLDSTSDAPAQSVAFRPATAVLPSPAFPPPLASGPLPVRP